jgi:hypothetical protein
VPDQARHPVEVVIERQHFAYLAPLHHRDVE